MQTRRPSHQRLTSDGLLSSLTQSAHALQREDGSLQLVGCRRYCNVLSGVTVHVLVDVHGWNVWKINQLWLFLQVNPRFVAEQNYGNSMHSPLLMVKVWWTCQGPLLKKKKKRFLGLHLSLHSLYNVHGIHMLETCLAHNKDTISAPYIYLAINAILWSQNWNTDDLETRSLVADCTLHWRTLGIMYCSFQNCLHLHTPHPQKMSSCPI